jgi:hypothetical protein
MGRVIIGMDPHKRSATIEVINDREKVLAEGRLGTDREGACHHYRPFLQWLTADGVKIGLRLASSDSTADECTEASGLLRASFGLGTTDDDGDFLAPRWRRSSPAPDPKRMISPKADTSMTSCQIDKNIRYAHDR